MPAIAEIRRFAAEAPQPGSAGEQRPSTADAAADSAEPLSVLEHDFVLWFGDLNYRINLDGEATRTLAERGEYAELRAHDQLLAAQRSGAAHRPERTRHLPRRARLRDDEHALTQQASQLGAGEAGHEDGTLWRRRVECALADVADLLSHIALVEGRVCRL